MVGLRVNSMRGYRGKLFSYRGVGIIMTSIRQLGVIDGLIHLSQRGSHQSTLFLNGEVACHVCQCTF